MPVFDDAWYAQFGGKPDMTTYTPSNPEPNKYGQPTGWMANAAIIPQQYFQPLDQFQGTQFRTPEKQQYRAAMDAWRQDVNPTGRPMGGGRMNDPIFKAKMMANQLRRDQRKDFKMAERQAKQAARGSK